VLLPLVGMRAMTRSVLVGMAIFEHMLFGFIIGLSFLPFQRRVPNRWPLPGSPSRP
jgi:hypothetical protein